MWCFESENKVRAGFVIQLCELGPSLALSTLNFLIRQSPPRQVVWSATITQRQGLEHLRCLTRGSCRLSFPGLSVASESEEHFFSTHHAVGFTHVIQPWVVCIFMICLTFEVMEPRVLSNFAQSLLS